MRESGSLALRRHVGGFGVMGSGLTVRLRLSSRLRSRLGRAAPLGVVVGAMAFLVGCGGSPAPTQGYLAGFLPGDVVGFRVVLIDDLDAAEPGPPPDGVVLARLLDAFGRSRGRPSIATSDDLVAVLLWRKGNLLTNIVAGPGYGNSDFLVETTHSSNGSATRTHATSEDLVEIVKELARTHLSSSERRMLDPEGDWLGDVDASPPDSRP